MVSRVLVFLLVLCTAFVVSDYSLGRAGMRDNLRLIVAAVFAVLVALFAGAALFNGAVLG